MAGFCAIIASDSEKLEEPSDFNEQMLLSPSTWLFTACNLDFKMKSSYSF